MSLPHLKISSELLPIISNLLLADTKITKMKAINSEKIGNYLKGLVSDQQQT